MSDFEDEYAQREEVDEARKSLEAFTHAMEAHPDLVQHLMEVQRVAYSQVREKEGGHVCRFCLMKQRFVRLVELIVLVNLLKNADDKSTLLYAIEWARRVPAVRLDSLKDL